MFSSQLNPPLPLDQSQLTFGSGNYHPSTWKKLKRLLENMALNLWLKAVKPLHSPFKTR